MTKDLEFVSTPAEALLSDSRIVTSAGATLAFCEVIIIYRGDRGKNQASMFQLRDSKLGPIVAGSCLGNNSYVPGTQDVESDKYLIPGGLGDGALRQCMECASSSEEVRSPL